MDSKNCKNGRLTSFVNDTDDESGFTGAQISMAYKAALSDFVLKKTNRPAIAEVSKLLAGALQARRQELAEEQGLSSQKVENYF